MNQIKLNTHAGATAVLAAEAHAAGDAGPPRTARRRPAPADKTRRTHRATLVDFIMRVRELFPGTNAAASAAAEARQVFLDHPPKRDIWVSDDACTAICYLFGNSRLPAFAVTLVFHNAASGEALSLLRTYTRLYNRDIEAAPRSARDGELWASLQQTRLTRTIARLATFNTPFFFRCLSVIEGARELTYEGSSFVTSLLVTKEIAHVGTAPGVRFRPLPSRIPLGTAMLAEKWVRAFAHGSVALVATARGSTICGVVVVPDLPTRQVGGLHASLEATERLVKNGMALIAALPNGDVWVRLGSGMAFLRRRGQWQYLGLEILAGLLEPYTNSALARLLARLALDASFERRGAILSVFADPNRVREVVSDHGKRVRPNRGLRAVMIGLSLADEDDRTLIRNAAAIDGAVIMDEGGTILDAACMVSAPSRERLGELGLPLPGNLPGARSTAAQMLSLFGVALKISDDGPISVFVGGRLKLEVG